MKTQKETIRISRFLSMVLRHKPHAIDLELDKHGWAEVDKLLQKLKQNGKAINREILDYVVETNNKKRFAYNEDGTKIRASQGHSIKVDLAYKPQVPPAVLYHGTASRYVNSIYKQGLIKGSRHMVHLSADKETAKNVGQRHGVPVLFEIPAQQMQEDGHKFYLSDNGVWLVEHVPVQYLSKL